MLPFISASALHQEDKECGERAAVVIPLGCLTLLMNTPPISLIGSSYPILCPFYSRGNPGEIELIEGDIHYLKLVKEAMRGWILRGTPCEDRAMASEEALFNGRLGKGIARLTGKPWVSMIEANGKVSY